ncbi:MAG: hypothetical protein ACPHRO_03480 [Nannocystaceae bacterium]
MTEFLSTSSVGPANVDRAVKTCDRGDVTELGSVFEAPPQGRRGPDLHVRVEVARRVLGDSNGTFIALPEALNGDGEMMRWTPREQDSAGGVRVQISADFPSGGVVRLRGQGAQRDGDDAPGDLLVEVHVNAADAAGMPAELQRYVGVGIAIVAALAGALALLGS